jgi:hypothetical protein
MRAGSWPNAAAEGIGLGGTLLLAHYLAGASDALRPDAGTILLGALLAVAMGTVLEGAIAGWAQGQVLVTSTTRITLGARTLATSLGACIAWTIGMLPSTIVALLATPSTARMPEAAPAGPPFELTLALAATMGMLLGPLLAWPQWRLLRRHAPRAWRWIAANAAAWGVGMVVVFAGLHAIAWDGDLLRVAAGVVLVCTIAEHLSARCTAAC